jgi:hypothetical protein
MAEQGNTYVNSLDESAVCMVDERLAEREKNIGHTMIETGEHLPIDGVRNLHLANSTGHQPPIVVSQTDMDVKPGSHQCLDIELADHVLEGVLVHSVHHVASVEVSIVAGRDDANPEAIYKWMPT